MSPATFENSQSEPHVYPPGLLAAKVLQWQAHILQQFSTPLTGIRRQAINAGVENATNADHILLLIEAGEGLTIPAAQSQFICQVCHADLLNC